MKGTFMQSVAFNLHRYTIDSERSTLSVVGLITIDDQHKYQMTFTQTEDQPTELVLRSGNQILKHIDGDNNDIATAAIPDIQQVHGAVYYCVRQMLQYFSDLLD